MTLPYAINTGKLEDFLKHIQTSGQPPKVTAEHLKKAGFTSSNDRYLPALFKALGFLDGSGVPTDRWAAYKNTSKAPAVLAQALREAYSGLFDLYPDAERKDDEAIRNWLRAEDPKASETTVNRSLGTFRALSKLANFESSPAVGATATVTPNHPSTIPKSPSVSGGITINVELHIPADGDEETFEALFAAMRKHLWDD